MKLNHRFIFLDGLRGIAAVVVVIFHFSQDGNIRQLFPSAPIAVDLFFCLSGFVIAWAYYQKLSTGMVFKDYFIKRLIRLYPMFLVGLAFGILAFLLRYYSNLSENTPIQFLQGSILNFFYLPYFVVTPHEELKSTFLANPVYWSLFFELFANIAFIFTIRLSKINLLLITILLGCWLGLEGHIFHTSPGWSTNNFVGGFPRVGYSFMVGVLIFKYFDLLKALPKLSSLVIVALFVLIAVVPNKNWLIWYFPVIFIIPFIVITGARVEIENSFINKILEYLGWISYPLYCLHFPIISIWRVYSPNPAHFYKELIILLPLTFLITHLVAKKLDDPVRDWLTKKNRKIVVVKSFS